MNHALIIDDSPDLRRLLTRALVNEGIDVDTAEHGKEAIEVLEKIERPCVILLDLMMPVMDGFQFLEWKNAQHRYADWPVIVLSASAHTELPQGAHSFLKKPVDLDQLIDAIEANCR